MIQNEEHEEPLQTVYIVYIRETIYRQSIQTEQTKTTQKEIQNMNANTEKQQEIVSRNKNKIMY